MRDNPTPRRAAGATLVAAHTVSALAAPFALSGLCICVHRLKDKLDENSRARLNLKRRKGLRRSIATSSDQPSAVKTAISIVDDALLRTALAVSLEKVISIHLSLKSMEDLDEEPQWCEALVQYINEQVQLVIRLLEMAKQAQPQWASEFSPLSRTQCGLAFIFGDLAKLCRYEDEFGQRSAVGTFVGVDRTTVCQAVDLIVNTGCMIMKIGSQIDLAQADRLRLSQSTNTQRSVQPTRTPTIPAPRIRRLEEHQGESMNKIEVRIGGKSFATARLAIALFRVREVRNLHLSRTNADAKTLALAARRLKWVRWLFLIGCPSINDQSLRELLPFGDCLDMINLTGCNCTDACLSILADMEALSAIVITDCTGFTEAGLAEFRVRKPGCTISR